MMCRGNFLFLIFCLCSFGSAFAVVENFDWEKLSPKECLDRLPKFIKESDDLIHFGGLWCKGRSAYKIPKEFVDKLWANCLKHKRPTIGYFLLTLSNKSIRPYARLRDKKSGYSFVHVLLDQSESFINNWGWHLLAMSPMIAAKNPRQHLPSFEEKAKVHLKKKIVELIKLHVPTDIAPTGQISWVLKGYIQYFGKNKWNKLLKEIFREGELKPQQEKQGCLCKDSEKENKKKLCFCCMRRKKFKKFHSYSEQLMQEKKISDKNAK